MTHASAQDSSRFILSREHPDFSVSFDASCTSGIVYAKIKAVRNEASEDVVIQVFSGHDSEQRITSHSLFPPDAPASFLFRIDNVKAVNGVKEIVFKLRDADRHSDKLLIEFEKPECSEK